MQSWFSISISHMKKAVSKIESWFSIGKRQNYILHSLQSSVQRLASNRRRLSNVEFAFCGFRTKTETCWESCFGHSIKASFYQKPIFIEMNHFYSASINFTLKLLEPYDSQMGSQNGLEYKPKSLLRFIKNYKPIRC